MPIKVADDWASYEQDVVPADAGKIQRQECQRAFYAGAWAILTILPIAPEIRQRLQKECEEFKRRVLAGDA